MGQGYRIIVSVSDYEICDTLGVGEEEAAAFWTKFESDLEDWLGSNIETLMLNYDYTKSLGAIVFSIPIPQVTEEHDEIVDRHNEAGWEGSTGQWASRTR